MKAAVFHSSEDLRVEEVPEPELESGQVKLKNAYTGICGSDLHLYYSPETAGMDFSKPHPLTGAMLPQILGHEFSGTIVEKAEDVTGLDIGDRVAVWPVYYCGTCAACDKGKFNVCKTIGFHGLNSHGGGMADYTTLPASKVHKLPDSVDLRMGALVEPMAVAWHAVSQSGIQPGQSALIAGAGPIGIGLWFALRAQGIERVVVSEPSEPRRQTLISLGAEVVDPVNGDVDAAVAALTDDRGVDAAFDAAGVGAAISSGLNVLAPGGSLVIVAIHQRPSEIFLTQLVMSETQIIGALSYLPEDFEAVIEAMSKGLYDATGWVEDIAMDDVVAAIEKLHSGNGAKFLLKI